PASMNSSSRATVTRNWPALPRGARDVDAFIPVARITEALENPGGAFRYNGRTHQYPTIKMICWSGGNPFHHHQDLFRLEKAWQAPDTVMVTEHAWTATARRADIVLPATTPLERDDIMMMYRERRAVYMSALREPPGEARNDYDIFSALAARLGAAERFTLGRTESDWLQVMWNDARKQFDGLPDFETFRAQGVVDADDHDAGLNFLSEFVADPDNAKLSTPSGKIEVASRKIAGFQLPDLGATPSWTPPREWLGDAPADMLHLISPQPNLRLHAQNDAGDASQAAKVQGREPCYLHPETAASRGVHAGDIVVLSNARGRCLAGVVLHGGIRRDCIALATGAWMDVVHLDDGPLEVHGNPNVLTYDAGTTTLSQGNPAHTALVRVDKWTRPVPPVTVFDGPTFVTRD
ncbi:MAG: molybdopterin dinucleotide binding domain-containing protein, partial [Pseudomonadota bacterium]